MDVESAVVCCKREKWEVAKGLINAGANLNEAFGNNMYTALHYAAMHGNVDMCKFLVARNALVNAMGKDGSTPLHLAVAGRHRTVALFLVGAGADIGLQDKKERQPFLHASWHEILFPCLITPLHATIVASIDKSAFVQQQNLQATQRLSALRALATRQQRATFQARTQLYDTHKHRRLSRDNCASLTTEIENTRASIARTQAAIAALEQEAAERSALLLETEAAIVDQTAEHARVVVGIATTKAHITSVHEAIDSIRTRSREKFEALKCIRLFPSHERLQELSCIALVLLARIPDYRYKLLVNGLVSTWLATMERFARNASIQAAGCAMLVLLVDADGAILPEYVAQAVRCVSVALATLRAHTMFDFATPANISGLCRFVSHVATQQELVFDPRDMRSIDDSLQLLQKQSRLPSPSPPKSPRRDSVDLAGTS
ncbi:hypothetical protein ACHHYP_10816 [Achlya hypogyna]|uniref:Uncharacterized protein n=1 Tax=Achlya hypogyna TaxID=1202772 RepID=A0A1V9YKJ0_ACHHY|nr:hypothetical protein ACHHYP_10816 [Achlya hypogyna]